MSDKVTTAAVQETERQLIPLFTRDKQPGDAGFVAMWDAMKKLAWQTGYERKGDTLVYVGPDTYKFVDWTPIPHGVEMTVVGFIHCSTGVMMRLPCGVTIGMNVDQLAERVSTAG